MSDKKFCSAQLNRAISGRAAAMAASLFLGACASVPDVTLTYRPVAWSVGASVVQTITCTRDGKRAIVARGATFTPVYRADMNATPFKLPLKDLDRYFADSDLTVSYTDDGRLKSINQSSTGQGEAITKAAVGTVAAVGTLSAGAATANLMGYTLSASQLNGLLILSEGKLKADPAKPDPICDVVNRWSAATGPTALPQISIVQTKALRLAQLDASAITLDADEQATVLLAELSAAKLDLSANVAARLVADGSGIQPIAGPRGAVGSGEVPLKIQQTGSVLVMATRTENGKDETIGSASVIIPLADTFTLPIPKPALFGKQTFMLTLGESGRITSIGYGRTAGAASGLNAFSSLAGAKTAEDTAETAALKAAADLIAQQSRLNQCVLDPAGCK